MRRGLVGCALVGLVVLTGCSGARDGDVSNVAEEFVAAVGADDGDRACALLAPSSRSELEQSSGQSCARAILDEVAGRVGATLDEDTFGTMARIRFQEDTMFLTRFRYGWRVLAAGCSPQPHAGPYDCQVKGG